MGAWRDQFNYPWWVLLLWVQWAAQFAVLEFLGVYHNDKGFPTLTYLSLHAVPRFVLAMFLGWLCYHFLIQYALKGK